MAREILFKAKRKDNGEWVEGSLLLTENKAYIAVDAETMSMDNECTDLYATEWYEVDKDTICQFTGLLDKNGNKIWENDVVKYKNADGIKFNGTTLTVIGKVVYNEKAASFAVYGKDEIGGKYCDYFPIKNVEVIGNIFDNPKLLGGAEDDG